MSEKLQDVESILKKHVGKKHVIGEDVRGILEIVMATIDPKLAESNVIDVIADYDVIATRELIATLRRKIDRLRDRIGSTQESRVTKWMLGLTLASKVKKLEEQQDNLTTTPPSSDDEEDDENDRDACPIAEDRDNENTLKILKANRDAEVQATQTSQKYYKTLKSIKDDDFAETWENESRPWDKVNSTIKPAAWMSTPNTIPPAAEVSNRIFSKDSKPSNPSIAAESMLSAVGTHSYHLENCRDTQRENRQTFFDT